MTHPVVDEQREHFSARCLETQTLHNTVCQ